MNARIFLLVAPFFLIAVAPASAASHKAKFHKAKPDKPMATTSMSIAPPKAAPGGSFRDVPPGHWAARAVETLHGARIVRGYPVTTKKTQ